jgi:hypothetical protein
MHAATRRAVGAAVLLLTGSAAAPVSIAAEPVPGTTANFTVSITGKFTSHGTEVRTCQDANDNPITAQRVADTTWTFATTKAGRAQFSYDGNSGIAAGMTRLLSVAATGSRTASETPNCAPFRTDEQPVGSTCSAKHEKYLMSIYANPGPPRLGYGINENISHLRWPDDPWLAVDGACPPLALTWGKLSVNTAPPTAISQPNVFNKRVRRIVVNGHRTGHGPSDATSNSTWTLEYTVVLTRRG